LPTILSSEIISKYKEKCEELEPDIKRILEEEAAEREIAFLENRANKMQKTLEEVKVEKRNWFQSKEDREKEKGDNTDFPFG